MQCFPQKSGTGMAACQADVTHDSQPKAAANQHSYAQRGGEGRESRGGERKGRGVLVGGGKRERWGEKEVGERERGEHVRKEGREDRKKEMG